MVVAVALANGFVEKAIHCNIIKKKTLNNRLAHIPPTEGVFKCGSGREINHKLENAAQQNGQIPNGRFKLLCSDMFQVRGIAP